MSMRRWIVAAGVLCAIVLAAGVSMIVRQEALRGLENSSQEQVGLLSDGLHSAIVRYAPIPELIGASAPVQSLLENPSDASRVDAANRFLESEAASLGAAYAYLLDAKGRTIAASNWAAPDSFVGKDYSFRPYYRDAVATCLGAYYGIGVTTAQPGYFQASCIRHSGALAGVAVIKIDFRPQEASWRQAGEQVVVVDGSGIVFLASDPAWRYRPLHPLDPAVRQNIRNERRYADEPLDPVLIGQGPEAIDPDLLFTRPLIGTDWSIVLFESSAPVRRQTASAFAVALLGGLVVTLISVVLHMRSARLRTERSAKRQLEERVEQRTNELRSAHDALEAEIEERSRIDGELHRARGQLAQANRLAAIGQAFAGLAHEINQPLTALKTALASSRLLAARGQTQELDETIDGMMQTVDRMAELSQDLKDLARRREHRRERVSLAAEAARVVNLVRFRATDSGTTIVMEERDRGIVIGDPVRLQQVAMNLVLNALDAVAGCEHRLVRVSVDRVDGMAELRVADSGAGISPEQRGRLFEPFFTTKAEGHGLGLGLAISNSTVREHGGTVTGTANEGGGAVFCVRIPLAEAPAGQAAADAAMPQ